MTAEDRGWGPAPTPRRLIVDCVAGSTNVPFAPGVHEEIEPIVKELVRRIESQTGEAPVPGHCWGYAPRRIRGSSTRWSNHAWGLAIDYNAPAHPMGSYNTWGSHGQALSDIADDLMFRWGGDYSRRPDEMHFEFMGTPTDARRIAAGLGNTTQTQEEEMLQRGDKGRAVKVFQTALRRWNADALPQFGADSDYGGETEEWVKKYQQAAHIPATGKIGGVTAALLGRYVAMGSGSADHAHNDLYVTKAVYDAHRHDEGRTGGPR